MIPPFDREIERLFVEAVELPETERIAYVDARATDALVRAEVLALLEVHEARGPLDRLGEWLRSRSPGRSRTPIDEILARMQPAIGERYRIEGEIGRGGMAVVLLAEDLKHRRKVALKVLEPGLASGVGSSRFLEEISIVARLAHPHVLPLHDSGDADGLLYYVMPYVEGESLRDRLRREPCLPVAVAVRIASDVADALAYAHAHGVVHCDVKPGNIMLQAEHALVADFGIARALSASGGEESGESGPLFGTPGYVSPERARRERIDERDDIYGLGCVLYEMLTGAPPGGAGRGADALMGDSSRPQVPELPSEIPQQVASVVRRSLAPSPEGRFASAAEFREALSTIPGRSRSGRWAVLTSSAVAAVVIGVTAWAVSERPGITPDASVVAVLPLAPGAPDTTLARLGRDLVLTLSANLDGVGEIRVVDALSVLAQTSESSPLSLNEGAALARRLGASSVAHGTIVRLPPNVRVDLTLYSTDSLHALARASVVSDPERLATLTDSLTWALLRGVWRTRAPPTPNLGALTTRSVPALRAFLAGERAGLAGRWDDAAEAFRRAMLEDSTFWLAQWRYSYARWWYLESVDDTLLGPLFENRFALPERDRLVLESWWSDTISVALDRGREAVERFPAYWPGWMQYADWLFHVGPVAGYGREEAQSALESTVALNPNFLPAWEHLYWLTIARDTVVARRALEAMDRLGHGQATEQEYGFDITRVYRLESEFARTGRLDRTLLDSVVADLTTRAHGRVGGGATLPAVQGELSRAVLRSDPTPQLASAHESLLAEAWAARGAWEEAVAAAERHAGRVGADPLEAYRYASVGAWLGAVEPRTIARVRVAAERAVSRPGSGTAALAELAWLDGLVAVGNDDQASLAQARANIRATQAETAPQLERSLAAFDIGLGGDWVSAADSLALLDRDQPDLLVPGYDDHPYVIAISRLAAARIYREQRNPAALDLLMWFDAMWALDGYRPARRVLTAFAVLERGRALAAMGDTGGARSAFLAFLRRYDVPAPGHGPLISEAQAGASGAF